jgi:hypothetical protein
MSNSPPTPVAYDLQTQSSGLYHDQGILGHGSSGDFLFTPIQIGRDQIADGQGVSSDSVRRLGICSYTRTAAPRTLMSLLLNTRFVGSHDQQLHR